MPSTRHHPPSVIPFALQCRIDRLRETIRRQRRLERALDGCGIPAEATRREIAKLLHAQEGLLRTLERQQRDATDAMDDGRAA